MEKCGWLHHGDFIMLRKELTFGFIFAGLASTFIPIHIWSALLISGHGFISALENAIIGSFIAFISFVCSIGIFHSQRLFGRVVLLLVES